MNLVVVGGHTRNIGKTSVMARLIGGFASLGWTAVKITQYGHGICSLDGQPCGCEPREHGFALTEEKNPRGRADTCRYLAAGARRSLWLRARQGQLSAAVPALHAALAGAQWVIIESNSILEFVRPVVFLFVLDSSATDFKASARRFIERADALVTLGPGFDDRAWDGLCRRSMTEKPVFSVHAPRYFSAELRGFVDERLRAALSPERARISSEAPEGWLIAP